MEATLNRATIARAKPTKAGRSAGGGNEAARVRKLEATSDKKATKRELIVVATGSHECSEPLHFQLGWSFG